MLNFLIIDLTLAIIKAKFGLPWIKQGCFGFEIMKAKYSFLDLVKVKIIETRPRSANLYIK